MKLDELLLNSKTKSEIDTFMRRPAHALIISGLAGSGKTALAQALAANALDTDNLESYPYFTIVRRPEGKQDIPIESIREVIHGLRLRTTGRQSLRRIIFIEDGQHLSTEAQNVLLKALEEPASDTAFILTVPSTRAVLPTISSRAHQLQIRPVALEQAESFFNGHHPSQISSAWQLSQGRAGLMSALLNEATEHPLKQAVDTAKRFLGQSPYERLLELDKLSKDKEQFSLLLDALDKVLGALERINISRDKPAGSLLKARKLIANTQSALAANTSPKLISLKLALNLKI